MPRRLRSARQAVSSIEPGTNGEIMPTGDGVPLLRQSAAPRFLAASRHSGVWRLAQSPLGRPENRCDWRRPSRYMLSRPGPPSDVVMHRASQLGWPGWHSGERGASLHFA